MEEQQKNTHSEVIDDEVIRDRVRKLIGEPKPPSIWRKISTNTLVNIIVGFLLTGIVGGALTHYYNQKQRDIEYYRTEQQKESERLRTEQQRESDRLKDERQKEFQFQRDAQQREAERIRILSLELNKLRLQKVGELLEMTYVYEDSLERTFQEAILFFLDVRKKSVDPRVIGPDFAEARQKDLVEILRPNELLYKKLIQEINRNRFWVGDEVYKQINNYVEELFVSYDKIRKYFLRTLDLMKQGAYSQLFMNFEYVEKVVDESLGKRTARLTITFRTIRDELLKE
jgi:hypothetical protein